MRRKLNKKGFTLAELLIVVAIIGVLVAISIPIFNNQLRKVRLATNQANARAAYAAWVAQYMDEGMPVKTENTYYRYEISTGKIISHVSPRNFGTQVCKPNSKDPSTDISTWKTTTQLLNPDRKLGSYVYKYWELQVINGEVTAYYAYATLDGKW